LPEGLGISDDEVLRYVAATFPSVWTLEVLLALKHQGDQCSRDDLVSRLRASDLVVSKALDALVAAGLVSIDGDTVSYVPMNSGMAASVERTEELYRRRPRAVFRAIVLASTSSATAFADAFRLRRP
jgi:DNA-binding IclR family transcriptional regulator